MERLTLGQRLSAALFKPRQVVLLDGQSGNPARSMQIRPISIIIIFLTLPAIILAVSFYYAPVEGARNIIPQHMQLQRQYDDLQKRYHELKAISELKDHQIEGLRKEIASQYEHSDTLAQRLIMLENILKARKSSGIQLLQATMHWSGNAQLSYRLTLVKGGNYPRRVKGSIAITTQDPDGNIITLALGKSRHKLPYRMETHTFLQGHVIWTESWKPNKLLAIVYDNKGKEVTQTEIVIKGDVL